MSSARLMRFFRPLQGLVPALRKGHRLWVLKLDGWLLFSSLALVLLGWVLVSSASVALAEMRTGIPYYFALRQGVFLLLAAGVALVISQVPLEWSRRHSLVFFVLAFFLLLFVLIFGREVNGSTRWLSLGLINLQVSEVTKIFLLIYFSSYLARHLEQVRRHNDGFLIPAVLLAVYGGLLLLQPDYGALVVIAASVMGVFFLAGARLLPFIFMVILALVGLVFLAVFEPYRMQRLISFTDPWARQFDSGYQLTQALIAFGRGQWTGLGLGNSVQKLFYLPEAHTDFIFSILAEELGLIGALITLLLFTLLIVRIFLIGRRSEKLGLFYGAYLCYGFGVIFAVQLLINLGVNTGLLPTKGLTLPLMSYGGSSLLASGMMLGFIFRVDLEARKKLKSKTPKNNRGFHARQAT